MQPIEREKVQSFLDHFLNKEVYFHLETSNGSYASLEKEKKMSVVAFIRNGKLTFTRGSITGGGPYCAGLKLQEGWVYAEGLTDFEITEEGQLLLGGYDDEGRLGIALELSFTPFTT